MVFPTFFLVASFSCSRVIRSNLTVSSSCTVGARRVSASDHLLLNAAISASDAPSRDRHASSSFFVTDRAFGFPIAGDFGLAFGPNVDSRMYARMA